VTQDKESANRNRTLHQKVASSNHYTLLGVHPSASVREIRQTYRELSKLYHPDTTTLPGPIATQKFQQLNEAYATLSNPDRRTAYDQKIGYSRIAVSQPLPSLNKPQPKSSSAYLDATDRPLSAGEVFALFILGLTFVACLILAITIGLTRGEEAFKPIVAQEPTNHNAANQSTLIQQVIAAELKPKSLSPERTEPLKPNPSTSSTVKVVIDKEPAPPRPNAEPNVTINLKQDVEPAQAVEQNHTEQAPPLDSADLPKTIAPSSPSPAIPTSSTHALP
jgi:hypothetical protein